MMILLTLFLTTAWAHDCHYQYTVWNTRTRSSEGPFSVKKWKAELTPEEEGPLGCTICEEDQVEVSLPHNLKVMVCRNVAGTFLRHLSSPGLPIVSLLGYRPSRSRGPVNERGLRTLFSNHAYGVAIDVNENQNGLYSGCLNWNPSCVLTKGGPYRPGRDPLSLTADSVLTKELKAAGFRWGGEITGNQKDFMHFSPDGY